MLVDLAGGSGFIDGICAGEPFMANQQTVYNYLSSKGKEIWDQTRQQFGDVWGGVTQLLRHQQVYKEMGYVRNDTAVYYLGNVANLLDAGQLMQNYVMAEPNMVKHYYRGVDIYPEYQLPEHHHVSYGRATSDILQYLEDDTEVIHTHIDHGYEDLHEPSSADKRVLAEVYAYLKTHVVKNIKPLMLNTYEEGH